MRSRKKSSGIWKQMKMNIQQPKKLWDTPKAVLRGKFIALKAYLKTIEIFQISNLILHLKELEKQQQTKPKRNRRKEIINIRAELNVVETKKKNSKDKRIQELVL